MDPQGCMRLLTGAAIVVVVLGSLVTSNLISVL
jgi:hypothetical protein